MAQLASLALDGGDPRRPSGQGVDDGWTPAVMHKLHDPTISFEEYHYYAGRTRELELQQNAEFISSGKSGVKTSFIKEAIFKKKPVNATPGHQVGGVDTPPEVNEKKGDEGALYQRHGSIVVTNEEWTNAARAVRTAGWSSVFYLITTDILGPFSTPWAFGQMGYGPGVALYTVFGALAGYTGWQLWHMFLGLDSYRYPLKNYGDVGYRVYGAWARHSINILQVIQLIFTVAILILSNGQSISQIAKGKLCFIVCLVIFMAAGMIIGQIRTLQKFGWLANFAVWVNLLLIFIIMGVVAHSAPNYASALSSASIPMGPVVTHAGLAPGGFTTGLNGLNQAVYSYGGAMLFLEFLSEMRHPMDFWKGLLCADLLIYVAYMFFGLFVYSYQGQFAINPAPNSLSPYHWQVAANVMNIVTGLIAAALYGNIGIKVLYVNVFEELIHAPSLITKKGKLLWVFMVPVYWGVAFVICAAIPQFSYISGLIGACAILQFTYTFPPILYLGYIVKRDAILPEEQMDPATGKWIRIDSGMTRWVRGFKKQWLLNSWNIFFALGAATTAVLGIYSSVLGLISGFSGQTVATSFGCAPPV